MQKTLSFSLLLIIFGCQNSSQRDVDKNFVQLFAEVSLFYEKNKIELKETDSLYQIKIRQFLSQKGTTEEQFRKQSENLMNDYKQWQKFLQDVSKTVDSLKAIRN